MTDNELRVKVLEKFYEHRRAGRPIAFAGEDLGGIEAEEFGRISQQLDKHGLLEWHPSGQHPAGFAEITARGIDVVEGTARSSLVHITHDDRRITVTGSSNVQIGNQNSIEHQINLSSVAGAIERSGASDADKAEAKSLWGKLTTNPTFAAIVGAIVTAAGTANGAQSPAGWLLDAARTAK